MRTHTAMYTRTGMKVLTSEEAEAESEPLRDLLRVPPVELSRAEPTLESSSSLISFLGG